MRDDDASHVDARFNNLGPLLVALGFGPLTRWVVAVVFPLAPGLLDVVARCSNPLWSDNECPPCDAS